MYVKGVEVDDNYGYLVRAYALCTSDNSLPQVKHDFQWKLFLPQTFFFFFCEKEVWGKKKLPQKKWL